MPVSSIIFITAAVAVFALFALALAWAQRQTSR